MNFLRKIMDIKINSFIPLFLFFVFFSIYQYTLPVENLFISDPLVKAVMIDSIRKNNFKSEHVIYHGDDLDKELKLHPLNEGFILRNNGKIIGQYPAAFTFLYSIIPIGIKFLPYTNSIFLLSIIVVFIILFPTLYNFKLFLSIIGLSILIPLSIDLSEYPIFFFFSGVGFFIIWKDWNEDLPTYLTYIGSFFLGISIWFRLEAILFSFPIFLLFLYERYSDKTLKKQSRKILVFTLAFIFPIFLFVLFNYFNYGHFLGPRYFVNVENSSANLSERTSRFISIIFTNMENGIPKFGFFFITPIFLLHIINEIRNIKYLPRNRLYLLIISVSYLIMVGIFSPNDGITISGRYACLAVFPLLLSLSIKYNKQSFNLLESILIAWSAIVMIIILLIIKISASNVKPFHNYFTNWKDELAFATDELTSSSFGLNLRDNDIYAIRKIENINLMKSILKSKNANKVHLLKIESFQISQNSKEDLWENMIKIMEKDNYYCNQNENNIKILHFICIREQ